MTTQTWLDFALLETTAQLVLIAPHGRDYHQLRTTSPFEDPKPKCAVHADRWIAIAAEGADLLERRPCPACHQENK